MLSRFLRTKTSLSLSSFVAPKFCSTPIPKHLDFNEFTRVYRRTLPTEELEYTIEDQGKKVSFTITEDSTIQDLKNAFQAQSPDIQSLQALSIDLAEYANLTKLSELGNEAHYMVLNDKNLCKVVSLDQDEADLVSRAYRSKEERCLNIGLPFIEQQMIINYLKRVDFLNRATIGKNLFSDDNVFEGKVDKKVILKNLLDGIIDHKNQQEGDEEQMIQLYQQHRIRLEQLKEQREVIEKKAHSITKWKMSLGLMALFGQFAFVGVGTYYIWSWDVVEPMAYFLNLSGSIVLSALYFRTYKDYSNVGYLKYLKEKEMEKLYKKYNFPIEEMRELEATIELIEKKIKSNILVNL